MKKIAAINDLSGFGRCSLTVNMPIISALGVQCCPLPTGILSNQTGYDEYVSVDFTDNMQPFIEQWERMGASFEGIISGFISNARQGEIIEQFIDRFRRENTVVVVDPVMADDGVIYDSYDDGSISAICRLAAKATVITPNLTELCILTGNDYFETEKMDDRTKLALIKDMSASTGKTVVTTGINLDDTMIANTIYNNKTRETTVIKNKKIGGGYSGTGDILASIIAAQAVKGVDIAEAVKLASRFIAVSIESTAEKADNNYAPADGIDFESHLSILVKEI